MLDSFDIISTSGVVLWSKAYAPVSRSVINGLINDVFIEETVHPGAGAAGDGPAASNPLYKKDRYSLKWTTVKDLGLIFVVGYTVSWACRQLTARHTGCISVHSTSILGR